jgi:hypothetical protein
MSAFVLDASVTAAWLLPDGANEHTRRLYGPHPQGRSGAAGAQPLAVGVFQHHRQRCARGRIPGSSVEGLWNVLEAVRHRVELHELAPAQHKAALASLRWTGLSAYDGGYSGCPLLNLRCSPSTAASRSGPTCGVRILDIATL